jgi:hypothetical protein
LVAKEQGVAEAGDQGEQDVRLRCGVETGRRLILGLGGGDQADDGVTQLGVYDTINHGAIDAARLRRLLANVPQPEAGDGRLVPAVAVTHWLRT